MDITEEPVSDFLKQWTPQSRGLTTEVVVLPVCLRNFPMFGGQNNLCRQPCIISELKLMGLLSQWIFLDIRSAMEN
ncbi:hypothetical protein Pyn_03542 [Prunus yedoensis var. nudiflora]|uniref:Uncharacterized protein n=1 Tax=Prunus yedoensis var. nudiflora TaxID=2094558 RepID=A0A314UTE1_PRUYE|nr:hypothetical protein Pyn_03542 [Prunus yedoensis var. nudiflora]